MDNYFIGIPIALTSLIPHQVTLVSNVRNDNSNNQKQKDSKVWLNYFKPIETDVTSNLFEKINSISNLSDNWDGYSAVAPDCSVIYNSIGFLRALPRTVISDLKKDSVTATPYGTLVIDFIKNTDRVSVEIGERKIGFFSEFKDGQEYNLQGKLFNQDALPIELLSAFQKLFKETTTSRSSI
ncbi:MAG TPA: hypothetical protein VHZ50_04295 [Puia sp.]|nr:hypothetical protein [Puia sp.]